MSDAISKAGQAPVPLTQQAPRKSGVGKEQRAAAPLTEAAPADYNVNLSPNALERQDARRKATDIARKTPDVREDRVAALKSQIKDGTYQLDSGKIADAMLREAIKERLADQGQADG